MWLDIGNPLTFNDPLAAAYGTPRFKAQEGLFGSQLTNRFKLLKNKRWIRRQAQAETDINLTLALTRALH